MDFKCCEGVGWIYLVQDKDRWWSVVNTVMNLRILLNGGIS